MRVQSPSLTQKQQLLAVKPLYGGEDREDISGSVFSVAHDEHEGRDPNVRKAVLDFLATAISQARAWQATMETVQSIAGYARPTAPRHTPVTQHTGTKIIIGHGRSLVWRELKDFLEDDLKLEVDEFDSEANAGKVINDRLIEMKEKATMAFLVMTAEEEVVGGGWRARQNVVHEVGYFQAALGPKRAIILLEEGCEKFRP